MMDPTFTDKERTTIDGWRDSLPEVVSPGHLFLMERYRKHFLPEIVAEDEPTQADKLNRYRA